MPAVLDEKLLTPQEVAELLHVHPMTVKRYVAEGHLKCSRLPGNGMRFRREDVEAMLQQKP